jgi:branched-chain amino acid transport system permease protein
MDYALHIVTIFLIWGVLALSQGITSGYLGVLSVHQGAAMAIGAYTAAIININFGIPLGLSMIPAALAAGISIAGMGVLVGRGSKDEQVIASLCIQMVVIELIINLPTVTGGTLGIAGISWGGSGAMAAREWASLLTGFVLLMLTVGTYFWLGQRQSAAQWSVVRDDRLFAESLGINVGRARLEALFLSAALAGAAGSVFAHFSTFVDPSSFGLPMSVAILSIAVIGGAPSVRGVALAALLIVLLPEFLRALGMNGPLAANLRQALFGVCLVASFFRRTGR